jgi:hypothetical protein
VLEEAAYVDPGFFYETVAPLLLIGNTSLIAISTLTSEINFYTRLLRMRDKVTGLPLFTSISVQLACKKCIEDGQPASCVHMLHLVPRWQSSDRHVKLKTVMQDRPDLIESELSGLAFDSNHQIFKSCDLDVMFSQRPPRPVLNEAIFLFIDPAAGGPQSDYAILSVTRHKGLLTVSPREFMRTEVGEPRARSRAEVGRAQPVHKVGVPHALVLDPRGEELVGQGVVEALGLVRAQAADPDRGRLGHPPPHALVLVEQREELDLQHVQRVGEARPHVLQRLAHAGRRVLLGDVQRALLDEARDGPRAGPVQHVE